MGEGARHDAWQAGDSYDPYMGRWSRRIAPRFLDWLAPAAGARMARDRVRHGRALGGDAGAGGPEEPRRDRALRRLCREGARERARRAGRASGSATRASLAVRGGEPGRRRLGARAELHSRPGEGARRDEARRRGPAGRSPSTSGTIRAAASASCARSGTAAVSLDPAAGELTEDRRFPFCTPDGLVALAESAGLAARASLSRSRRRPLFKNFDDFWTPFTLGAGPAPGYCMSLPRAPRAPQANFWRPAAPARRIDRA